MWSEFGARRLLAASDEVIDWNVGQSWRWGWFAYMTSLSMAIILNSLGLWAMTKSPALRKVRYSILVRVLMAQDIGWSVCCMTSCTLNVLSDHYFSERIGCTIQGWYIIFWVCCTGFTMVQIAHCSAQAIASSEQLSNRQILRTQAGIFVAAATIASVGNLIELPRLNRSGTYCMPPSHTALGAICMYGLGILGTVIGLCVSYARTLAAINRMRRILRQHGAGDGQVKAKEVYIAKRMGLYVLAFFGCWGPLAIGASVEWFTGIATAPLVDGIGGFFAHLNSVLNPIMYFAFQSEARLHLRIFLHDKGILKLNQRQLGGRYAYLRTVSEFSQSTATENQRKLEFVLWLQTKDGYAKFQRFCRSEWNEENLAFFIAVHEYKKSTDKIARKNSIGMAGCDDKDRIKDAIVPIWTQFLNVPHAPLEVNISSGISRKIRTTLERHNIIEPKRKHGSKRTLKVTPDPEHTPNPDIENPTKMDLSTVFDAALQDVTDLMFRDSYPRYRNMQRLMRGNSASGRSMRSGRTSMSGTPRHGTPRKIKSPQSKGPMLDTPSP